MAMAVASTDVAVRILFVLRVGFRCGKPPYTLAEARNNSIER